MLLPLDAAALAVAVTRVLSSSRMAAMAWLVTVTSCAVPDTVKAMVKFSTVSGVSSSTVATVNVCASPAVPLKAMAAVLAV